MAFDISALGSYVQNNGKDYAIKSIATAKTAKALINSGNVQYGVKGSSAILKLSSDVVLTAGGCGRSAGTTISISNKNIVVKPIANEANLCPNTLWSTFASKSVTQGQSPQEELVPAFVDAIMTERSAKIAAVNEQMLWQGDLSLTGSTNMKFIDGIGVQVTFNATSATTGSTIITKLQNFVLANNIDVRMQDDFVVAIGEDVYAEYLVAVANSNFFNTATEGTLVGTNAKFHVTSGLNTTRKIYGVRWSNLQLGLDGEGDADKAEIFYDRASKYWFQDFAYAMGVAVVWPEEAKYATV